MSTEIIDPNLPLDADQRETLQRRAIKKHDTAVILLHWFNAAIWLLELSTGGALLAGPGYRIAPDWWRTFMVSLFGSPAMVLKVHITAGVLWTSVLLIYGIFGFRKYLVPTVTNYLVPDRDDLLWVKNRLLQILGKDVAVPPQGTYNGGQKLYGIVVYLGAAVIIATGLVMARHWGPTWLVQWAILLHFVAVGSIFAGLFVHVYMGAVLPEERPAFFSMFSGKVPELYAYRHHYKWWRSYKETEATWREALEAEANEELHKSMDGTLRLAADGDSKVADDERPDGDKGGDRKADSDKADSDKAGDRKAGDRKADSDKADSDKGGDRKADSDKADGDKADSDKGGDRKADSVKADSDKADKETGGDQQADGDHKAPSTSTKEHAE